MYFSGLDAHLRYVTVAVLDRLGGVALETTVPTREPDRLLAVLAPFRPLEVVVETCPFWPWLYDLLVPAGIGFHLAHAKALRAIATAPQKSDAVDARLLARMLLSGLIPEAYPRSADQRELLRLLRHRTALVRFRTRLAGRIHSQLHQQRLSLPREKRLRGALVSAIPSHVRYAPTSPGTVAYEQLKARLGWRVARVAAARKLARVVYVMLTRRAPWHGVPAAGDVRDEVQNSHVAPTTSFC